MSSPPTRRPTRSYRIREGRPAAAFGRLRSRAEVNESGCGTRGASDAMKFRFPDSGPFPINASGDNCQPRGKPVRQLDEQLGRNLRFSQQTAFAVCHPPNLEAAELAALCHRAASAAICNATVAKCSPFPSESLFNRVLTCSAVAMTAFEPTTVERWRD